MYKLRDMLVENYQHYIGNLEVLIPIKMSLACQLHIVIKIKDFLFTVICESYCDKNKKNSVDYDM